MLFNYCQHQISLVVIGLLEFQKIFASNSDKVHNSNISPISSCQKHFDQLASQFTPTDNATSRKKPKTNNFICSVRERTIHYRKEETRCVEKVAADSSINWNLATCQDKNSLIFDTRRVQNTREYKRVRQYSWIVDVCNYVTIICTSVSVIKFEIEGQKPLVPGIEFQQGFNTQSKQYWSELYIPYFSESSANYTFTSSVKKGTLKWNSWFQVYFTDSVNPYFLNTRYMTQTRTLLWDKEIGRIIVPCVVKDSRVSKLVHLYFGNATQNVTDTTALTRLTNSETLSLEYNPTVGFILNPGSIQSLGNVTFYCHIPKSGTFQEEMSVPFVNRIKGEKVALAANWEMLRVNGTLHIECPLHKGTRYMTNIFLPTLTDERYLHHCSDQMVECPWPFVWNSTTNNTLRLDVQCADSDLPRCSVPLYFPSGRLYCSNATHRSSQKIELDYESLFQWDLADVSDIEIGNESSYLETFHPGDIIQFRSSWVNFLFFPQIQWSYEFSNGSMYSEPSRLTHAFSRFHKANVIMQETMDLVMQIGMTVVYCTFYRRDSFMRKTLKKHISVRAFQAPILSLSSTDVKLQPNESTIITCTATGEPIPSIRWGVRVYSHEQPDICENRSANCWKYIAVDSNQTTTASEGIVRSVLLLNGSFPKGYEKYSCIGENKAGFKFKYISIREEDYPGILKCRDYCYPKNLQQNSNLPPRNSYSYCPQSAGIICSCRCNEARIPTWDKCSCSGPKQRLVYQNNNGLWSTFLANKTSEACLLFGSFSCFLYEDKKCYGKKIYTRRDEIVSTSGLGAAEDSILYPQASTESHYSWLQWAIMDVLCGFIPSGKVSKKEKDGLVMLDFSMEFDSLMCNCTTTIQNVSKVMDTEIVSDDSIQESNLGEQKISRFTVGVFTSLACLIAVVVVGIVWRKLHAYTKTTTSAILMITDAIKTTDIPDLTVTTKSIKSSENGIEMDIVEGCTSLPKQNQHNFQKIWTTDQPLLPQSNTPIGSGYFGSVWPVKHTLLDQNMALKKIPVLRSVQHFDGDFHRVLREMRNLSKIDDIHIVKFYYGWMEGPSGLVMDMTQIEETFDNSCWSSGQSEGAYFLFVLMELCQGNLEEWLSSRPKIEDRLSNQGREVLNMFDQILDGMVKIHDGNIIHRDIKPNNIFWTDSDKKGSKTWKIGDFGLSRHMVLEDSGTGRISGDEEMTHRVGCERYQSPEMLQGKDHNRKTDVYSLGLVFVEMLIPEMLNKGKKSKLFNEIREGNEGLHGIDWEKCLGNIGSESFSKTGEIRDLLNILLKKLVSKMLRPEPSQRPNAAEANQILNEILSRMS